MGKIQSGFGSGKPLSQKKGLYGKRSSGKICYNGGFSFEPTMSYESVSDEQWEQAFGSAGKPWYERDSRYQG